MAKNLCQKHYDHIRNHGRLRERTIMTPNKIELHEEYAEIILYDLRCEEKARAKIDLLDVSLVKDIKWSLNKQGYVKAKHKGKYIRLHRFLMNPHKNLHVDHINHDKRDNRRSNLRVCTRSQNMMNQNAKGISFIKRDRLWRAYCGHEHKYFKKEEEAKAWRKKMEKEHFGEFAYKPEMVSGDQKW